MRDVVESIKIALSWYSYIPEDEIHEQDIKAFKKLECFMRKQLDY